jgi:hypothetical protein
MHGACLPACLLPACLARETELYAVPPGCSRSLARGAGGVAVVRRGADEQATDDADS